MATTATPPTVGTMAPQYSDCGGCYGEKLERKKNKRNSASKTLLSDTVGKLLTEELAKLDLYEKSDDLPGACCLQPGGHLPHCPARGPGDSGTSSSTPGSSPRSSQTRVSCQSTSSRRKRAARETPSSQKLRGVAALVKSKPPPLASDSPDADVQVLEAVERLAVQYGTSSHMGILDPSYHFFVNKIHSGALCYKLQNEVAIVTGDPLCESDLIPELLDEFTEYRRKRHWKLACIGVSASFAEYAHGRHWTTIEFGVERVLNPMTNDVLMERSGKRIIVQNKQLLNPAKRNQSLRIYIPSYEQDRSLEDALTAVYDAWRCKRSSAGQAYVTVYDLFDFPDLMIYIYTCAADGTANGFVALRWIGAHQGYHLDPCVMAPDAPKGVSDLLIYATLAFLKFKGVSYLSLGFEPLEELREIRGMPKLFDRMTRSINRRVFRKFHLNGKKAHSDKFRTDLEQESGLYVVLPTGILDLRQVFTVFHTAHIRIRKLI